MKKILALILGATLSFGQLAYAQETVSDTASLPVTEPSQSMVNPTADVPGLSDSANSQATDLPPAPDMTTDEPDVTSTIPEQGAADAPGNTGGTEGARDNIDIVTPIQDTTNAQDTVAGGDLQGASNPEDLATTTITVDASSTPVEASSTPISIDATTAQEILPVDASTTLDVIAQDVQPAPAEEPAADVSPPDATPTPEPIPASADEPISAADLAPRPEYTIAMTGKHVAAKRTARDALGKQQTVELTETVAPQIDNTTGSMQVSGSCSNTYFVILLFKGQDDYARDPKSYILDKAFPCVGGQFSYSISDLPDSLSDGTYYLLVGEEGDKGPWAPITALTEVTINRNH